MKNNYAQLGFPTLENTPWWRFVFRVKNYLHTMCKNMSSCGRKPAQNQPKTGLT